MNNDIRPPRRPEQTFVPPRSVQRPSGRSIDSFAPTSSVAGQAVSAEPVSPAPAQTPHTVDSLPPVQQQGAAPTDQQPINPAPASKNKPPRKKWVLSGILVVLGLILVAAAATYVWYNQQLAPMSNKDNAVTQQIKIESGTTPDQIAQLLHDKGLVRSKLGFLAYTRIEGVRGQLQAGSYIISTNESMEEIVGHLTSGRVEEYSLTFYPGAALRVSPKNSQVLTHKEVLQKVGFSDAEIEDAFTAQHDHPLLASKPANSDLEGYIYGETFRIAAGSSVEQILERTFDEFYDRLESEGVIEQLASRNMTLHDAVTLASVVEREVARGHDDQRQVAQVFRTRLEKGMPLGADATFVYAAAKMNVAPSVDLDSPYNTRKYGGLPPGPIASPSVNSLKAVANPASGDYLYFVSGDDGTNYFSKTLEEHEAKTRQYCQKNCSLF